MNAWPFILAAYGITLGATLALTVISYVAMKRSEK